MTRVGRARRRTLLAAAALLAFAGTGAAPVRSADAGGTGWWWRTQTGVGAPLPSPPVVPPGGLMVSGAPDGANAVAALRWSLDADETSPILTLRVAHDTGGAEAIIGACPAGSAWVPAEAGRWDTAPTAACDLGSVNGVRAADGGSWTFALGALVVGGVVDVVLVPGKVSGRPARADGSSFQLAFHPPDPSALVTESVPEGEEAPDAGFTYSDLGSTTDYSAYLPDASVSAPSSPFAASLTPEQQVVTPSAPLNQRVAAARLPAPKEAGGNFLGFLVALGVLAAPARASRATPPPIRRLGPLSNRPLPAVAGVEAEVAGLGRFARPRVGAAPKLH